MEMLVMTLLLNHQQSLQLLRILLTHGHTDVNLKSKTSLFYSKLVICSACGKTSSHTYCSRATEDDRIVVATALRACQYLMDTSCRYVSSFYQMFVDQINN